MPLYDHFKFIFRRAQVLFISFLFSRMTEILKVPLDVIAEFILKFLTQKEILHMLSVIRRLNRNYATWKAYFLGYSSYYVPDKKATSSDFLQKSIQIQTVRNNWFSRRYRTVEANLPDGYCYRAGACVDSFTDQVACISNTGKMYIYSPENTVIRKVQAFKSLSMGSEIRKVKYRNRTVMINYMDVVLLWKSDSAQKGKSPTAIWDLRDLHDTAFSSDASSVFSTQSNYLCQYSVQTGQPIVKQYCLLDEPYGKSYLCAFPDDTVLTGFRNHFKVWDMRQKTPAFEFKPLDEYTYGNSAVGESVAYYYSKYSDVFKTFDLRNRKMFDVPHCLDALDSLRWTPDGLILTSASRASQRLSRYEPRSSYCRYLTSLPAFANVIDVTARKFVYTLGHRLVSCDFEC